MRTKSNLGFGLFAKPAVNIMINRLLEFVHELKLEYASMVIRLIFSDGRTVNFAYYVEMINVLCRINLSSNVKMVVTKNSIAKHLKNQLCNRLKTAGSTYF